MIVQDNTEPSQFGNMLVGVTTTEYELSRKICL